MDIPKKEAVDSAEENGDEKMIGCTEEYEEEMHKMDVVDGNFTQDPFTLKASDKDHTPNHTVSPKSPKPEYGKFSTGRFGL